MLSVHVLVDTKIYMCVCTFCTDDHPLKMSEWWSTSTEEEWDLE